jgi:hypothetical protein
MAKKAARSPKEGKQVELQVFKFPDKEGVGASTEILFDIRPPPDLPGPPTSGRCWGNSASNILYLSEKSPSHWANLKRKATSRQS